MHHYEALPTPREYAEQVLINSRTILDQAAAIVSPENGETDPLHIFPAPHTLRAEDPGMQLSQEQEQALLEQAAGLGFGKEENVTLSEQGLQGSYVIIEGGQPHKIMAELDMVALDGPARPDHILMAASAERQITNPSEIASAERLLGKVGETEYDVALDILREFRERSTSPTYRELPRPIIWHIGYNPETEFTVSNKPSGQFQQVGAIEDVPVVMFKIDGKPGTDGTIHIANAALKLRDVSDETPITFVTSGTYRPSRAVATALVGLQTGRPVGLATYGNDLLNEIKGTNDSPPLNQLPGELYKMAQMAVKLEAALAR